MARRLRLVRAWACYWSMVALEMLFPRSWHRVFPLWQIDRWLLRYGAWWALRLNPNLPGVRGLDGGCPRRCAATAMCGGWLGEKGEPMLYRFRCWTSWCRPGRRCWVCQGKWTLR